MTRYLFVMWAGGGNVNPFLGLGGLLLGRGHQVGAVAPSGLAGRLGAAGVDVVHSPDGWLAGPGDVAAGVEAHRPDVLVVDYMLTGALCGAEAAGLPTVALVHTLYRELLRDGAPDPIGMAGSVAEVNEVRAAVGLAPIAAHAALLDAVELVLVTAPRELDAPGEVPGNVVYAGALFEGPGPDEDWRPPAGDEPLVVVSLGTAGDPDRESAALGTILDAIASLPVRGLVNLPDYLDADRLGLPANVTVSGYVRHAAVLPHADLLVTHGGLGSVVAALANGVPMVVLPLDRDQPANARAVARLGAGCALPAEAGDDAVAEAIEEQLRAGRRIRLEPAPGPAVDRLEALAPMAR